jgi:hypothetical protein
MNTMNVYVSPEQKKLLDRVEKIILSCHTKEQVLSAYKYYKLWEKKNEWELNVAKDVYLNMKAMAFIGMIQGMLKILQ